MFISFLRLLCAATISSGATLSIRPPSAPVRTPAEFEPVQAVLLQWRPSPSNGLYAFLIDQIQQAGATPYIVTNNTADRAMVHDALASYGLATQAIHFIVEQTNTVWMRDYGPVSFYEGGSKRLAFADFLYTQQGRARDDLAPLALCSDFRGSFYRVRCGSKALQLEGGDFLTDGFGSLFSSVRLATSNGGEALVAKGFKDFLALSQCHFLPCLETVPPTHIDMHVKLLDEETLLLGRFPPGVYDPALEDTAAFLAGLKSCYGKPYRIVRIPMFLDQGYGGENILCTYTNALIVNDRVLVPQYNVPSDQEAIAIYEQAMPGYWVLGYDCRDVIRAGGAIHCITREIPREEVVRIAHPRINREYSVGEDILFEAQCWSQKKVDEVFLRLIPPDGSPEIHYAMPLSKGCYRCGVSLHTPGQWRYSIAAFAGDVVGYKPQNGASGGYLTVELREPLS